MLHHPQPTRSVQWNRPVIIPPAGGETLQVEGISCQFKITTDTSNDLFGVYQIVLQPHTVGARLHYHKFTHEVFVVLKGTLTMQWTNGACDAHEGAVVHVPPLTPHGFCNNSAGETKVMLLFSPGQKREGFFRALFSAIGTQSLFTQAFQNINLRYDTFPL